MQDQIHAPPASLQFTPSVENGVPLVSDVRDDVALVMAARKNPTVFGQLYQRYYDRVYAYLLARTGDVEDAADLTQQVFLKALDALAQFRPQKGTFAAWLFGIARHSATNFQQRRLRTVAWDYPGNEIAPPGYSNDLEETVLQFESFVQLRRLCASLAPAKQEMLALRFVAGLTSAEIGALFGKSEAAVKIQLTRILHSLKEQYHELSN